jgi:hypothetical protein
VHKKYLLRSMHLDQLIVFSMHLLAATVAWIYICVVLAPFLGLISLYICLLPTCILLACLVWWWVWVMSLVVSAVRWPCRLFIQFWAGVRHIMAYEYARGRRYEVQVCLVSEAWPAWVSQAAAESTFVWLGARACQHGTCMLFVMVAQLAAV